MGRIRKLLVTAILLLVNTVTYAGLMDFHSTWYPYFYSLSPAIAPTLQGSELLGSYPYINTDLHLLQQRLKIRQYDEQQHLTPPDNLQFLFGGRIQERAYENYTFAGKHLKDLYLYKAEIYNEMAINQWLTGFVALAYDSNTNAPGVRDPQHLFNDPVFFDRAFITLGNLYESPFYSTSGLFWAPFGVYNTFMLTPPLTRLMSFTKVTGTLAGYMQNGLSVQLYTYKGNTALQDEGNTLVNQMGLNFDYDKKSENADMNIGGGYISNMADANGMQDVKVNNATNKIFTGFGSSWSNEILEHNAPGMNLHTKLNLGPLNFIGEWNRALRSFAANNLSFDHHGAKPQAWTVETGWHFSLAGRPNVFALGYGHTSQALALNLAQKRYVATFTTFLWRHTRQKLEFKHELNYPLGSSATGQGLPSSNTHSLGKSSNTITVEFSYFF